MKNNIRIAQPEDINIIAALHAKSWQENYIDMLTDDYLTNKVVSDKLSAWRDRLLNPTKNQLVLVAEQSVIISALSPSSTPPKEVVGFVCLYGDNDAHYGTIIDNLHIISSHKGQGIGKKLWVHALQWAKDNYPESPLYLEVLAANNKAITFYESLGGVKSKTQYWSAPCGSNIKEYIYCWDK